MSGSSAIGARKESVSSTSRQQAFRSLNPDEGSYKPFVGSSGMSYRPLDELGEGGTARVFLACATGPNGFTKLVVLKILRKQLSQDDTSRLMFQAEARLSARLNHPNLVQIHEVVEGELPFLVMEYLDGKPLSSVLESKLLSQRMLLTVLSEGLIGLHHAHELRDFDGTPLEIVHRDISPHNIFLTYDGAVKVLDFGIAQSASNTSRTETGEIKGKLAYMAPEQLLGEKIDRRADIFAVGCILWEVATGSRMWEDVSEANLMHRLATGEIPNPAECAQVAPALQRIIAKATASAPEERYATALELQRDLSAYVAGDGASPPLRDIGAALAEIFEEERQRNKDAVRFALQHLFDRKKPGATDDAKAETVPQRKWAPRAWWFIAIALLAIVGGILVIRARAANRIPEPPIAAPRPSFTIAVRASPPEAIIEIDGKETGSASVVLSPSDDGREHSIRVAAPGFVAETRIIRFDRNQEFEIVLQRGQPVKPEPVSSASERAPSHAPSRRNAAPKRKTSSPEDGTCSPPYYFNQGIKVYKPQCL